MSDFCEKSRSFPDPPCQCTWHPSYDIRHTAWRTRCPNWDGSFHIVRGQPKVILHAPPLSHVPHQFFGFSFFCLMRCLLMDTLWGRRTFGPRVLDPSPALGPLQLWTAFFFLINGLSSAFGRLKVPRLLYVGPLLFPYRALFHSSCCRTDNVALYFW